MRHQYQSTSPSSTPLANAFAPDYLIRLREQEEVLTAAEAELAGPGRRRPFPASPGRSRCSGLGKSSTPETGPSPCCGMRKRRSS